MVPASYFDGWIWSLWTHRQVRLGEVAQGVCSNVTLVTEHVSDGNGSHMTRFGHFGSDLGHRKMIFFEHPLG